MKPRLAITVVAALVLAVLGVSVAVATSNKTVRTLGDEVLRPNVMVQATLRFSPGPTTVAAGDSITWVGADKPGAPHTVTLTRNPNALADEFADLFLGTCPDCDAAIGAAFQAHFGGGPPVLEVGTGDGFGDDGDSILFGDGFPNSTTQTLASVTPGETILYFCAFHPWMQGTINVSG